MPLPLQTNATSAATAAPPPPFAPSLRHPLRPAAAVSPVHTLDAKLAVEADETAVEKPRRAVAKVSFPPSLVDVAKRTHATMTAAGAGAESGTAAPPPRLNGGLLTVRLERFGELQQLLVAERATLRAAHPIEAKAAGYGAPLSEASAGAALEAALPAGMVSRLFPFQREGVAFALRHDGRVLIADEMGLGKTVQAICTALCYGAEWPLLVLCPASLCANWRSELVKWMELAGHPDAASAVHVVRSGKDQLRAEPGPGVAPSDVASIISYDLATKLAPKLDEMRFGVCVCDESHVLKNPSAARTKALLPLAARCKRLLLLSGTPVLSRPIEIYTQAAALRPALFASQREFELRYCAGHHGRFGWDNKGACNTEALCAVMTHTFMVRREKAAVLHMLPAKLRSKLSVDIPAAERTRIAAKLERIRKESEAHDGPHNNPMVGELYREVGLAKAAAVSGHLVDTIGDGDVKALCFGHHHAVLDALAKSLEQKKIAFVRIDGRTPLDAREHAVKRFQNDAAVRVALLSISAAGVGLTLTRASLVVFAEISWDIGALKQAEDRAHRIGQHSSVVVQYCLADGTLDDWMWRTIERKLEVTTSAMMGNTSIANASSFVDGGGGGGGGGGGTSGAAGGGGSGGSADSRRASFGGDIRTFMGSSQPPPPPPPPPPPAAAPPSAPSAPLTATPRLWLHDALSRRTRDGEQQQQQQPPGKRAKLAGTTASASSGVDLIDLIEDSDESEG